MGRKKIEKVAKIEKFAPADKGKIVAFFDVRTADGFLIKGFKLIDGKKGHFVGFPSSGSGGKFFDTVFGSKKLKDALLVQVMDLLTTYKEAFNNGQAAKEKLAWEDDDIPF